MRILSGVQSSGQLHLGNYYGAIRQFVKLQDEGEALYFIANLHALTSLRDGALGRKYTFETALAFLALGVDPKRAALFRQSDVPEITELYWILGTVIPVSNLESAHSYRDKIENQKVAHPEFGLFSYPVLMAADILLYDTDLVPVGKDQTQHLEFARDWAVKFNLAYAPGYDPADRKREGLLKLPAARVQAETAVVPGTNGGKMSKTQHNTIALFGTDKEVEKAIKGIKTDSAPVEAAKPVENAPLYDLLKLVAPPSEWAAVDAEWRGGGKGYGHFKGKLLEYFHTAFDGPRQLYAELAANPDEVEKILLAGAEKARGYAAPVIKRVRDAVGL
jgi:tryptophanyl-tRNA synthetase